MTSPGTRVFTTPRSERSRFMAVQRYDNASATQESGPGVSPEWAP
jgi:hypothetical protein